MPPTTSLVGHGPQSFADMNNLLKAPIIEAAYVPPLYAHNQMSSEEILMKMTNAEQEGRDVDLVVLKEDHRRAYNREAMRKKRAMDNEEGRAYKRQRQEEHDELRKHTMEMIKQLHLNSSWYSTLKVKKLRVAISALEKLATLKKKRQFEDKKIVQNVINQFDGTESAYKEDINIYDKEAAELIQRLGMDLDDNEIFNAEKIFDI
jgi:hypothetical protein